MENLGYIVVVFPFGRKWFLEDAYVQFIPHSDSSKAFSITNGPDIYKGLPSVKSLAVKCKFP